MSQTTKQTFETYNPKEYRTKVQVRRAIKTTRPWQIPTPAGTIRAEAGDYIVEAGENDYYPVKPEVFEKSYEPLDWDLNKIKEPK